MISRAIARIQDNQGNFGSTAVVVEANGKDSIFFAVSGRFERSKDKCLATIDTRVDLCAGTAKGTYTGTISKPHQD